ncbi:MAG TPA: hypothetical protein VK427_25580, partial [Kofleriaceae bacterium]|nr:hypothetical protein [Kofleriaceae bacterium]
WRMARRGDGETRLAWALFAASWLVAGPLLAMRFNLEPVAMGLYVIQRFHQLPVLMLAVPFAVGLSAVAPYVARGKLTQRAGLVIASTLGLGAVAGLSLPHLLRVHTPAVEQYTKNVLKSLPEGAVMITGQDDEYFGTAYVQLALGVRPDVVHFSHAITNMPWYQRRVQARGIHAVPGNAPFMLRVVEYLHAQGKPVFVERWGSRTAIAIVSSFPTYPYGPLMRVLPRGAKLPSLDEVVAENKAIYGKYELGYALPGGDDEFATVIHHRYASPWNVLGRKLLAAGKREDAAWAFEVAKTIGPQPD